MNLEEAIIKRKSIRKYKNINVPDKLIEELIAAAILAPSAKNRQPWKFVIVKEKIKNDIADIMLQHLKETKKDLEKEIYGTKSSVRQTAFIMKKAPILILVFREKEENWLIGDCLSIGAAVEHICLKAVELELGSLWIRDVVYTQEKIAKLVGKSNLELISAISIGYPDENLPRRERKKINDVMEWYRR